MAIKLIESSGLKADNALIRCKYRGHGQDPEPIMKQRWGDVLEFMRMLQYMLPIDKIEAVDFEFESSYDPITRSKKIIPVHLIKPVGAEPRDIVLVDGGLKAGIKCEWDLSFIGELLARMGYVAISVSSICEVSHVEVHDYKKAIEFMKNDKNLRKIITDSMMALGLSSGGALALELAGEKDISKYGLKKVIAINTYADLAWMYWYAKEYIAKGDPNDTRVKILKKYMDFAESIFATPDNNPKAYKAASPMNYIPNIKVPIQLIHGVRDEIVPVEQGEMLFDIARKEGKEVNLRILPGQTIHGPLVEMGAADATKYSITHPAEVYGIMLTMAIVSKFLDGTRDR